jgi:glucose-1-phosphate cytidylyltransferase
MQVVILAGGLGTRISEESSLRPKPMIEIGGKPIIWHIIKMYAQHGLSDFIVCCGYKGYVIKEYFSNYYLHMTDVTLDMARNTVSFHKSKADTWRVTLVDTGEHTHTGGRLKRVAEYLSGDFCMTYGDGVSNVDVTRLIAAHKASGKLATVTAVLPPSRFGALKLESDLVRAFQEKPVGDDAWINGGFFVLSPRVLDRIEGDLTDWERKPLESLAADGELHAFAHTGFWQPMDTLRDRNYLEDLWSRGEAPWKTWA